MGLTRYFLIYTFLVFNIDGQYTFYFDSTGAQKVIGRYVVSKNNLFITNKDQNFIDIFRESFTLYFQFFHVVLTNVMFYTIMRQIQKLDLILKS